jgi:hypothetical protein
MRLDIHTWNRVLLKAHGGDKEAVNYVLSAQLKLHGLAHRHDQRCRNDIVATGWVGRIDAERVAFIGPGEFGSVRPSENAIRAGIAKIPLELRACYLNSKLRGLGWLVQF